MENFVLIISTAVYILAGFYISVTGLDFRKKSNWLFGVLGFLCGFASGFALGFIEGVAPENISMSRRLETSMATGFIFTAMILFYGAIMRNHQRSTAVRDEKIRNLYLQLQKRKDANIFARLAEKILEKFI